MNSSLKGHSLKVQIRPPTCRDAGPFARKQQPLQGRATGGGAADLGLPTSGHIHKRREPDVQALLVENEDIGASLVERVQSTETGESASNNNYAGVGHSAVRRMSCLGFGERGVGWAGLN